MQRSLSLVRGLRATTIGSFTLGALLVFLPNCAVQQVPQVPDENGNGNENSSTAAAANENSSTSGSQVRPIPSVPLDDPEQLAEIDSGLPNLDETGPVPLSIIISNFDRAANVLPGSVESLVYEVFGGRAEDGLIRSALVIDRDGIEDTGDELSLVDNLPVRGTVDFSTSGLAPGRYFVGIRARNNVSVVSRYAGGQLELVGAATLTVSRPNENLRVRPIGSIEVRATIETLAKNVSWSVFTDTDTDFGNGVFRAVGGGGGTAVASVVFPTDYPRGDYFIGINILDSLNQRFIYYFGIGTSNCVNDGLCRKFTIDGAPTISVVEPMTTLATQPGPVVTIRAEAGDAEGNATVTLFRDADGTPNNNEFLLATFQLTGGQGVFETTFASTGLFPGSYRFGAKIDDGAGAPVYDYADGALIILEPPSASAAFVYRQSNFAHLPGSSQNSTLPIRFQVFDPLRRLDFQPDGIRLDLFVDANTDGVADTDVPLLTTTNNSTGQPFRIGPVNSVTLDLTSQELAVDADGLVDVVGKITLNELLGNRIEELSTRPLARVDSIPPTLIVSSPTAPLAGAMSIDFAVRVEDNSNHTFLLVLLAPIQSGTPNEDDAIVLRGFFPIETNQTETETVQLDGFPSGSYRLIYYVADATPDLVRVEGVTVQIN